MKSPAFRFYPKDFLGSPTVQLMDASEVGAYMLMLCMAWENERHGYLPDDDDKLRRWARLSREQWMASRELVLGKFPVVEEGWRANLRMVEEAKKQERFSETQREKINKRWDSVRSRNESGDTRVSESDTGVIPSVSVSVSVVKSKDMDGVSFSENEEGLALASPELFPKRCKPLSQVDVERIRLAYPRKEKPEMARKAIRAQHALLMSGQVTTAAGVWLPKMTTEEATAYLHRQAARYAGSPLLPEPRFIPHPATWFNSGAYTEQQTALSGSSPLTLTEKLAAQRSAK